MKKHNYFKKKINRKRKRKLKINGSMRILFFKLKKICHMLKKVIITSQEKLIVNFAEEHIHTMTTYAICRLKNSKMVINLMKVSMIFD